MDLNVTESKLYYFKFFFKLSLNSYKRKKCIKEFYPLIYKVILVKLIDTRFNTQKD